MSQENVEVVRKWAEYYNRRDMDGLVSIIDADHEKKSIFAAASGGTFKGHTGFPFAYFEAIDDAYDHFSLEILEYVDAGAAVVMAADCEWHGKESGAEGKTRIFITFWLRAGKVFREETFTDRTEAMAAVGLSE